MKRQIRCETTVRVTLWDITQKADPGRDLPTVELPCFLEAGHAGEHELLMKLPHHAAR